MVSSVMWYVLSIFFWVACALWIVLAAAYVYIKVNYYRWDKEDREFNKIDDIVQQLSNEIVGRIKEEINNPDGDENDE